MTRRKLATKTFLLAMMSIVCFCLTAHFMVYYHRTGFWEAGVSCVFFWMLSVLAAMATYYRMVKLLAQETFVVVVPMRYTDASAPADVPAITAKPAKVRRLGTKKVIKNKAAA